MSSSRIALQAVVRSSPRLSAQRAALPPRPIHTSSIRRSGLTNLFDTGAPEGTLPPLSVSKLTSRGFHLSDNLVVPGGLIFVGGRVLLWDVDPPAAGAGGLDAMWNGWTKERFTVFETVVPRPEILLLGTGETVVPAPKAIREYISSLGIQLDVMDSRNAASTYNLLSEEGRTIGAALCPLKPIDPRTGGQR